MSKKNYDNHNRWRNKTVAFRVSAEEDLQLETLVKLTGLTKQDYINLGGKAYKTNNQRNVRRWSRCS